MIIPIDRATPEDAPFIGGKGATLTRLTSLGYKVPRGFCISTQTYRKFIEATGLNHKINAELGRRDLDSMRWEELWDTSLRIRNLFNVTPLPEEIRTLLLKEIRRWPLPLVVRSSAPGEDSGSSSFAGLHESYVDIRKEEEVLEKIKLVWSSLWSDSALLYRREMDLNIYRSSMGVVVQEMISGEVSGVAFSKNPLDGREEIIIEAVEGLNQKLVDGEVEPSRWIIDKGSNSVDTSTQAIEVSPLLSREDLETLSATIRKLEDELNFPIDLEWTLRGGTLYILQVRPITSISPSEESNPWERGDKRPWYRSLTLTFSALKNLRKHIEEEIFPRMKEAASYLEGVDLDEMTQEELREEIVRREGLYTKWRNIYWRDLIPFAHGVRLFAKVYNDTMKPRDPYEFTRLLSSGDLISLKRNQELRELISHIDNHPKTRDALVSKQLDDLDSNFRNRLEGFLRKYEPSTFKGEKIFSGNNNFIEFLLNSSKGFSERTFSSSKELEEEFLSRFYSDEGEKILEVARASWKFRDDDNLYLGRIETGVLEATNYMAKKFGWTGDLKSSSLHSPYAPQSEYKNSQISVRRFTGQPASPGIGSGKARIISSPREIFQFKRGEVLICDALDPNMTFIVPLASAIVEQRGGMLIHGAIIAREYGIPCVTGVVEAVESIKPGDYIIVDGYSGTVSISDL
ncbi:hypothetical protein PM10SUCC1_16220 [Propionigenium maris DSM 9537]|uniref:Pyruvate, water dikinase n=1 Tax=Propionigenium maris DSM 9537 TaxID=1123000 RepID=A0A9W6GJ41_9FUSO|nr:PEP/pyruvate-binding domain-containing protein [Propionigenium maris]GLI56108.1 hypothetical protein PM10SUCC1_16220 [Propionigenium maris DSM 9537]